MEKNKKQFRLPKAFAKKWLRALRSEKYKQGRGELLNSKGGYCCLGVAATLLKCKIKEDGTVLDKAGVIGVSKIPKSLCSESNLSQILIDLNDGNWNYLYNPKERKHTFKGIANWIEKNVQFV